MEAEVAVEVKCYHCGQPCEDEVIVLNDKHFCCIGCRTVYEFIDANNLCNYYDFSKTPGIRQQERADENYLYLDELSIRKKIVTFDSDSFSKVTFYVPVIHCISCVWLLEHLQKIEKGIVKSEVNFARKEVTIDFDPREVKLSRVAGLLHSLGYSPLINLDTKQSKATPPQRQLVYKLAVAGFCFGNVMLFSFPEYLGIDHHDQNLLRVFSWLNWLLSIPVFFYSGSDYIQSALKSFTQKQINIDVPIAAGLLALFARSTYDILTATGPGYLDSFTGLVFFLLIGRWFQGKTYESLAFDRDFKSYFPLAVHRLEKTEWKAVIIYELKREDRIRIRNMEIVPADSLLKADKAYVDYSFVTGESRPAKVMRDELVYAGGRLIGKPVELIVQKETSQSHLTSLWNHDAFRKREESGYQKIIDRAARKFTWIVMGIAALTALYWYMVNPSDMWLVLTSVLMVACPCALALAAPFTYGSMLRVFGKHQFYLKNADVIERMATVDAIVFDKTGTLTYTKNPDVRFNGDLSPQEWGYVKLLTSYSTHPLSSMISQSIHEKAKANVIDFRELPGLGLEAMVNGSSIKIGSGAFVGVPRNAIENSSLVFVSIEEEVRGYFSVAASVRKDITSMLNRLGDKCVALLSGDQQADKNQMQALFHAHTELLFNQSPHDKLEYIEQLQHHGKKVMMLGDGLNDAGAMKQSDVGIAVADDTGTFTPACDGILQGDRLYQLHEFITLAKSSSLILKIAFAISFFYNAIALSFAVTGHLTPLVAAILMPISSVSVVGFSSLAVRFVGNRVLKGQNEEKL